jgi:excisionase family DNA binding protein
MSKVTKLRPMRADAESSGAERITGRAARGKERRAAEHTRERLPSAQEAADMLGLKTGTIRNMTWRGELAHIKVGPRGVRYRESDLTRWIEEHTIPARH